MKKTLFHGDAVMLTKDGVELNADGVCLDENGKVIAYRCEGITRFPAARFELPETDPQTGAVISVMRYV